MKLKENLGLLRFFFFLRPTKKMHFKFLGFKKQGLDVSTYAPGGG